MPLSEPQARDLQRYVTSALAKVPSLVPRGAVLGALDGELARIPASLRSAGVGDVVDQLAAWRRSGVIR